MLGKKAKATQDGTCSACKGKYAKGDRIIYVAAVHEPCGGGAFTAIPPAPTLEYTRLKAFDAMEEAIQVSAQVHGVTDEMERLWARYEKLREVALRPGSLQEERQACRLAMVELVKLAFPS